MSYAPKPGCPMCGIVNVAFHSQMDTPSFNPTPQSNKPDILWKDDNFTVYKETTNPVSSIAHVIIAFNLHVPSIYRLASADLPLLLNVKELAVRFLDYFSAATAPRIPSSGHPSPAVHPSKFRIGFITPPFRDTKIPVTDHLHAHAYVEPADLMGWWRSVAYSPVAWYPVDDLIAEIREETSNNRIRSSMPKKVPRPIDHVPTAGARTGHANGAETTEIGLSASDANLEDGEGTLSPYLSPGPSRGLPGSTYSVIVYP
ncbi:hypothetical protein BDM02DRAFT_3156138 [Thelephora ganbajun]|uniref:Uncharacterized protein n=1 Tax=Thelephora ganbajun TaxID=370292 RepID=A0ACB6ZD56_THEGA|nr:hypothetical protein BDM02DRAFT_3156138 [Thelephora ganbajun]